MLKTNLLIVAAVFVLTSCGGGTTTPPTQSVPPSGNSGNNNPPPAANPPATNPSVKTFSDLCNQPGVFFCDDFENGIKPPWISDGDVAVIDGAAVPGEGSHVLELRTYENVQSSKLIQAFPNQDVVYVRFDVQYDVDYDNSGGSHGPVLGGSMNPPWGMTGQAGIKPQGDDYFTANFEPLGIVGVDAVYSFYNYFVNMDQNSNGTHWWGNEFTSSLSPPPYVLPGQWQCVEFALTMNTPGASNTDGTAKFWVNDVLYGDFSGFQWRTVQGLAINTFSLDSYNHFNNGALPASNPNRVRYDNVVLSTSKVGCL